MAASGIRAQIQDAWPHLGYGARSKMHGRIWDTGPDPRCMAACVRVCVSACVRGCVRAGVTEAIQVLYGSCAGVTEDILQFGLRVECNLGKGSIAIWSKGRPLAQIAIYPQ